MQAVFTGKDVPCDAWVPFAASLRRHGSLGEHRKLAPPISVIRKIVCSTKFSRYFPSTLWVWTFHQPFEINCRKRKRLYPIKAMILTHLVPPNAWLAKPVTSSKGRFHFFLWSSTMFCAVYIAAMRICWKLHVSVYFEQTFYSWEPHISVLPWGFETTRFWRHLTRRKK